MQGWYSTSSLFEKCKDDAVQLVCLNNAKEGWYSTSSLFEKCKDDPVQVICLNNASMMQYK